ncbi:hypothetical protein M433DRAFT_58897 [Acidomyces richmondensis BFW]|nr:MAG: hypothetical protein FE78DRAFT_152985 [Acidomyces sp. 'richmondensis']KYG49573.1 hypothetical protein M433DRAFT_58897 [Acidomyces richmondensis BFW]
MSFKPTIAIAGLGCETSTFTSSRTDAPAFHPLRGEDIVRHQGFLNEGEPLGDAANWQGALTGHALPGGVVTRTAFELLSSEILSRLEIIIKLSKGLDGLWFDIHGAMCVEDMDDSEAELLRRIRIVIGPKVIVSASMDLHGNVSRNLIHRVDMITCYRTAPHEDVMETRQRACRNLVDHLYRRAAEKSSNLPIKAWIPIPVLLAGEQTSTRVEPAKSIYASVPSIEAGRGILDAGIWIGYAWADEPRNRAAVVVTGSSQDVVASGAEKLAHRFWSAHKDFRFAAPTGSLADCLDKALKSTTRPFFISDSGDNPTAGGSGDVTWTLHQLLARTEFRDPAGPKIIYASIPAGKAIETVLKAGVGSMVTVTAGAEVDRIHAGPVTLTGRVHSIKHGDVYALNEVVIQTGSVFVILTELRKPYHHEEDFKALHIDPRHIADIVIIKIGYLEPELYDMAADWMLALTPGGVDQDLERLGYRRIRRPMWPFDKIFDQAPNLKARIIPPSYDPLAEVDD